VLAEITLRFLPVSTSLFGQPVNETSPVFRFLPDRDYEADTRSPLLAVIGDSYVEATMVPYAETLQGQLAAKAVADTDLFKQIFSVPADGKP